MANNTRRDVTLGRDLERKRGTEGSAPKGREIGRELPNNKNNKATGKRDLSKLGENIEREQSQQSKKNDVALEIIERTEFLRPLLYAQDIDLYNEDPSSGGYIKGRYVGKGMERRFERGDSSGHKDYLENSTITDIGFDGNHLYVVDNDIGHYRVNDPEKDPRIKEGLPPIKVTASEVDTLARNVSNQMGEKYTTASPIFDAELGYLRTNFVHPSVAPYGNTMALRVSRPSLAIKDLSDMATPEVNELLKVFMRTRTNLLISGSTGAGKAVADSELVPTPKGWKRHGDLKVGDVVFDKYGKPTTVIGVYPQGKMDVYRLMLKDGRTVDVSGDHLWTVKVEGEEEVTITTLGVLEKIESNKKVYLPRAKGVEYEDSRLSEVDNMDYVEIKGIEKLDEQDDMTCIMVDNEEHLYLVGDYVVTHNTEVQKSMVGYIPIEQKITLMEDTLDSHIKEIYPEKDINSWRTVINEDDTKVADNIDFHTLLRAALRNFPDWAMVSEVRGSEAGALLSVALSGHAVMTTMHTQGAESIPERLADMVSMGNSMMDYGALQRNILSVFKIGVHLERGVDPDTGKTIRYIREIYEFVDYDKDNGVIGYPIYRRYQQYDNDTQTYKVRKQHYRMSDDMLRRLEDNRELDNIPSVFRRGDYEHKTMADRRNITKGDDD